MELPGFIDTLTKGHLFDIKIGKYPMKVEITHISKQVVRFRIILRVPAKAVYRELNLEKRLLKENKRNPWRLLSSPNEVNMANQTFESIKAQIDHFLKGPQEPYILPKNGRNPTMKATVKPPSS